MYINPKIKLNDLPWPSSEARAKGMRRIAIAQLGSNEVDQMAFAKIVAEEVIKQILPIALRAAASVHKKQEHKDALEASAKECEEKGTEASAQKARAASAAAYVVANAADAAAYVSASAAADAASAASAAAYVVANAADAASAASAAANAANSAANAANVANVANVAYAAELNKWRVKTYSMLAEIAVTALTRLGCKGVQWLDLCK